MSSDTCTEPAFSGEPPAIKASLTWEEWLLFLRIWGAAIRHEPIEKGML